MKKMIDKSTGYEVYQITAAPKYLYAKGTN